MSFANLTPEQAEELRVRMEMFVKRPDHTKCAHNTCMYCHGTGVKDSGEECIHWTVCSCPKCTLS